jgi:hypothetical protein
VSGVLSALLVITVARGRKSGGMSEDEESSATAKKTNPEAV